MAERIQTITQDIVARVKAIVSFSNRVGLAVGGQEIDPINRDLPRPASWVVFIGDEPITTNPMNPCSTLIKLNFVVKILVDYTTETNLTTIQFPLLYEVIEAISGNEPVIGSKWLYEGQILESLEPNRMVWAQSYSIMIGV